MGQNKFVIIIQKEKTCFNYFLAVRKETLSLFEVNFSIVEVVDNTNRQIVIYSKISKELTDFKNENFQSTIQQEEKPRFLSR